VRGGAWSSTPAEAATVRLIFERYLKLRSVRLLKEELTRDGIVSKVRVSRKGSQIRWTTIRPRRALRIARQPDLLGEIRHRKVDIPASIRQVVDKAVWNRCENDFENKPRITERRRQRVLSSLAGNCSTKMVNRLYACGANKSGRRYRYYVSRESGFNRSAVKTKNGWRLPALEYRSERSQARVGRCSEIGPLSLRSCRKLACPIGELQPALDAAERESRELAPDAEVAKSPRNLIDRFNWSAVESECR